MAEELHLAALAEMAALVPWEPVQFLLLNYYRRFSSIEFVLPGVPEFFQVPVLWYLVPQTWGSHI